MLTGFHDLLNYPFFSNALLTAMLASISCGIAGTYIVARRKVFIAGGITHASFGGIGMGYFFGLNPVLGGALFGLLSALGIEFVARKTEIREDSAIGIIWSFGMALGIIFIFLTPGYAPNLMTYLFGNILTVSSKDITYMAILCLVIILFFWLFYRIILFVSFDEDYARSQKVPVNTINFILIALVALVIVINIRVTGIILVISFLTIPQSTANLFTRNFRKIIFYSIIIGLTGSFGGLFVSFRVNLPSGATIILIFVAIYTLAWLLRAILKGREIRSQLKTP
jgi:zinc transport system permease protein